MSDGHSNDPMIVDVLGPCPTQGQWTPSPDQKPQGWCFLSTQEAGLLRKPVVCWLAVFRQQRRREPKRVS